MGRHGLLVVLVSAALAAVTAAPAAAQPDPAPPPPAPYPVTPGLEEGIAHVRAELDGIAAVGKPPVPREQLAAQSAMTWVQGHLSPAISAATGGADDLETALAMRAGLCGHMVEAFMQIMQALDVRVLPVQVFFVRDGVRQSHVAAQVRWGGRWRYVDPTWGALFEHPKRGVLGPKRVFAMRNPARFALVNRLNPWTDASLRRGGAYDPFGYLRGARDRQVVLGGAGSVRPPIASSDRAAHARFDLTLMPDYVGRYAPYARQLVGVEHRFAVPAQATSLTLTVRGKLCGGLGTLHVGDRAVPFAEVPDAADLTVPLGRHAGEVVVRVSGGNADEACAVLLAGAATQ